MRYFWCLCFLGFSPWVFAAQPDCNINTCQVVIDAGSSGTRLYVYQNNQVVFSNRIEPGLSQLKNDEIPSYLQKLLKDAPQKPLHSYFLGTAGMRLLPEKVQQSHYQTVKTWFKENSEWSLDEVRTITGQEEGVFAWVAVNYLEEVYHPVLEIGGASMQVVFPIDKSMVDYVPAKNVYHLHLGNQDVFLWAKSYLGLGLNEVEKNFQNADACYSNGYPLANGTQASGNIYNCIETIEAKKELDLSHRLEDAKNHISSLVSPSWMVLGAIKYSLQSPPFGFQNTLTLREMVQVADAKHCQQNWTDLLTKFGQDPYLYRLCLATSYYYATMSDSLGIAEDMLIQYPKENNQTMDWTLGALLTHSM